MRNNRSSAFDSETAQRFSESAGDSGKTEFQREIEKIEQKSRKRAERASGVDDRREETDQQASEPGHIAFMASPLVQATFPHSDPGDVDAWRRQNGDLTLRLQSGAERTGDGLESLGLPYGVYPRLLLIWICTRASQYGRRRLKLGQNLQGFMKGLGVTPSGGENGTTARFREQARRLFSAEIGLAWTKSGQEKRLSAVIADEVDWWSESDDPEQRTLWQSSVQLSKPFFEAITKSLVPLDRHILREIADSALAIDVYLWTTYRVNYLQTPLTLSWQQVHDQTGADYQDVSHFAAEARTHLQEISLIWPDLQYETPRGRLTLYPSAPSVSRGDGHRQDRKAQNGASEFEEDDDGGDWRPSDWTPIDEVEGKDVPEKAKRRIEEICTDGEEICTDDEDTSEETPHASPQRDQDGHRLPVQCSSPDWHVHPDFM